MPNAIQEEPGNMVGNMKMREGLFEVEENMQWDQHKTLAFLWEERPLEDMRSDVTWSDFQSVWYVEIDWKGKG